MTKKLVNSFMVTLQDFYREHKDLMQSLFRGGESILLYLSENCSNGVVTPTELSDIFNISTARVAASLNSLEDKEYITREIDLEDRRKIIIKLTEKGILRSNELKEFHLMKLTNIITKLGEDDASSFIRIVEKLKNILKEEEELC